MSTQDRRIAVLGVGMMGEDEIFGAVLSVVRVESYNEALILINANPHGNGTAIFTNDGGAARRFHN